LLILSNQHWGCRLCSQSIRLYAVWKNFKTSIVGALWNWK